MVREKIRKKKTHSFKSLAPYGWTFIEAGHLVDVLTSLWLNQYQPSPFKSLGYSDNRPFRCIEIQLEREVVRTKTKGSG